jgi:hypothetical protein
MGGIAISSQRRCLFFLRPTQKMCHPERSSSRTSRTAQSKDLRLPLLLHFSLPFACHSAAKRRNLFLLLFVSHLTLLTLDKLNAQN